VPNTIGLGPEVLTGAMKVPEVDILVGAKGFDMSLMEAEV
jgi:hypothetical protein